MSGHSTKTPDAAAEGIYFFLNVTQHLFHIHGGGGTSPMPPPTTTAILSPPRITPATRQCIIYKANLSRKDCGGGGGD